MVLRYDVGRLTHYMVVRNGLKKFDCFDAVFIGICQWAIGE